MNECTHQTTSYENPSVKWLSTILGYLSIPSLILFLIVMGYYRWKFKSKESTREVRRRDTERIIVVKEKEKPYHFGLSPVTKAFQDELPKGGVGRALGFRKDGSVDFGFRRKKKRKKS